MTSGFGRPALVHEQSYSVVDCQGAERRCAGAEGAGARLTIDHNAEGDGEEWVDVWASEKTDAFSDRAKRCGASRMNPTAYGAIDPRGIVAFCGDTEAAGKSSARQCGYGAG